MFSNIGQKQHTIVLQTYKEAKTFKKDQRQVGVLKILNDSQSSLFEEIEEKKIKSMDKKELELISKNFGKYRDQFLLFKIWEIPLDFFSIQPSWVANHYKVEPFDYLKYSHLSPKIHEPDRLECELVSIKKHNNFVYEGQVLVTSQNFHGFGRVLQYQGGKDSGQSYVYEGWFVNGLAQGYGRKIQQDGTFYEGQLRFGLEHGEGERVSWKASKEDEHQVIEVR